MEERRCSVLGKKKDSSTIDIGVTLQFVWNTLVNAYRDAHFGEDPPGNSLFY